MSEDTMTLLSEDNERGFTTIRKTIKAIKAWKEDRITEHMKKKEEPVE